ncbi:MAG: tRNA preQ1(34) S-adenosylmethionine ribosyltransferase-isomerase QueA [Treponemataceae bacterium]|nr:tRNA preQ1(34) S-adenosylmethionine ribosyltransferase-isomerase QueA [Treponemataceae bacterium]
METGDFFFNLPSHLIAQHPSSQRGESRLMVVSRSSRTWHHRYMRDFPELLPPNAVIVFNNSRVRKSRLYGTSLKNNKEEEFLLLEALSPVRWRALTKKTKQKKRGEQFRFAGHREGIVVGFQEGQVLLEFDKPVDDLWLDQYGHIPLPPYIKRKDEKTDEERYQTVYAQEVGSVAAPTAGLHFTEEILHEIDRRGIVRAFVTLHVGIGTFLPVRSKRVEDHQMHEESYTVPLETAQLVTQAKQEGRPVVAIGTTSVRTLESAWNNGILQAGSGKTRIFIYPGYRFQVVDQLFTNFHTPESTLLMLVCAFADKDLIFQSYEAAIQAQYRFFSYGDAMYIQ